jgi:hypothetical protein
MKKYIIITSILFVIMFILSKIEFEFEPYEYIETYQIRRTRGVNIDVIGYEDVVEHGIRIVGWKWKD